MSTETGYRRRWPRELLAPSDVHELVCGMLAVHEAAHSVIGHIHGFAPVAVRVQPRPPPPGTVLGTRFSPPPAGDPGALIALAARPAVLTYLQATGHDSTHNRSRIESQFGADDRDAMTWAHRPLPVLHAEASAAVAQHWDAILALAERITHRSGQLDLPLGSTSLL